MNITATSCKAYANSQLPLPDGVVLKPHHYFGFRPSRTNLYSMFDRRNWAAHLGMGDEPSGWAIAGMRFTCMLQFMCSNLHMIRFTNMATPELSLRF